MALIPIISHTDSGAAVARRGPRVLTAADFLNDVARVAQVLPPRRFLVNFCSDRYRFAVGLAAALLRDQVSLLPPSQTPEMLGQLRNEYGQLYALTDAPQSSLPIEQVAWPEEETAAPAPGAVPAIPAERIAAIAFTSGSTGRPTAHRKSWGALARGAAGEALRFGLQEGAPATLVGTVPPQHMYGLESSVLMALRNGLALHAARPFYPADVRAALEDVQGDRVLITTPVHLRALLEDNIELPALRLIICATAPLSPELAARAEARFAAPLHEVYGFTEAGMVATRRTTQGPRWHSLPDVRLSRDGDVVRVAGGHVEMEVPFSDVVELQDDQSFILHGRSADMVNIAGRRTSLAYLNHQLNSIEGVRDGVFLMPEDSANAVVRPLAFAVAPGLSREGLMTALRDRIDAVFLPRPLHLVEALPRNATGKLGREALMKLAKAQASAETLTVAHEPATHTGAHMSATHTGAQVPATLAVANAAVTLRKTLPLDHPALPGHFPGNPILPGVVLLDQIIGAALDHGQLANAACVVRAAKFLRPVRPGEELTIRLQPQPHGRIRFECSVGGELAVSGSLQPGSGGGPP